ncbi:MAG: FtsQ-type POTRA domain-containing protein [Anaerolineae bacterium]|nr:FtsQ-type POTRA domain-containing protein [Anaerolineae bacterium]
MASRSRESRRRSTRLPGVWHGGLAPAEGVERPLVQHGVRGRVFVGWRVFSGLIIVSLLLVLFLFFSADAFYIHSIAVGGLEYLTKEEVFALSDIANLHVFWVDPEAVRQNILRSPTVADARVTVGWPPRMVQIIVQERQPALVWEQSGVATWIDVQGRVMQQREDRPDLLRISDYVTEGPLAPNTKLDTRIISGALQLRSMFPTIDLLRYHPNKGLGYQDGRGWEVWFGIGTDMPEKILVYDAIVANLLSRNIQPTEINVANPDAPYYSVLGGGE